MIKKFAEFINEGFWKDGIKRAKEGDVRREDGIKVKLPDGKDIIIDNSIEGVPYKLDGDNYYKLIDDIEGLEFYVFGFKLNGEYIYYYVDVDDDTELIKFITSDYDMVDDDFSILKAVTKSDNMYKDLDDGVVVEKMDDLSYMCTDSYEDKFAIIYGGDGDKKALEFFTNYLAIKLQEKFDYAESSSNLKASFYRLMDKFGCNFFDMGNMKYEMRENGIKVPKKDSLVIDKYIAEFGIKNLCQYLDHYECARTIMEMSDYDFRENYYESLIKEEEEFKIDNKTIFVFSIYK